MSRQLSGLSVEYFKESNIAIGLVAHSSQLVQLVNTIYNLKSHAKKLFQNRLAQLV